MTGTSSDMIAFLRAQAQRCSRIALIAKDPTAAAHLIAIAVTLNDEADRLGEPGADHKAAA
ncbi:MAG TPA: hypothetical protein VEZ20_11450 [Allosphingosinicella sp.]|jgi:hypothetical protein|nr:hypothetical protein [Allosphingosinicella sp.]